MFSENSMKKFKEKIYGGLTFQKKKFLEIFLKNRIFLPSRYSAKESCKNGSIVHFEQKVWNLVRNVSVYVITKMNEDHFLSSSMKQVIRKQKMKNHFHENFFVVWFDTQSYCSNLSRNPIPSITRYWGAIPSSHSAW